MDLNMMMREQARNGLQSKLDAAVTNGETEAARKIADEIAALDVATAPKKTGFGDAEIKAAMNAKADWFGVDPRKSAKALEFGKNMDPKKFATPEAFADAVIKAVDEDSKPAAPAAGAGEGDDEPDDDKDDKGEGKDKPAAARRSDGPGEGENTQGTGTRRASGPWTKLSDAPADIQKEIKRSADKFVSSSAPKELREKYIANALASHYNAAQQRKARK